MATSPPPEPSPRGARRAPSAYDGLPDPARLPDDAYAHLEPAKQIEYVKEQMDAVIAKKRVGLETGTIPADRFQSGLRELLDLIRDAGDDPTVFNKKHGKKDQLGAVLQAGRDAGKIAGSGKSTGTLWKSATRTAKLIGRLGAPASVRQRSDQFMLSMSASDRSSMTRGRAAAITASASNVAVSKTHDAMAAAAAQRRRLRARKDKFEVAGQEARQMLKRRNSFPPAMYNARMLKDANAEMSSQVKEMEQLQQIIEGTAPREEEVALQKKVATLETQVTNQIGLVKGLREKLRVTAAERDALLHRLREVYATGNVDDGFGTGLPASVKLAPRAGQTPASFVPPASDGDAATAQSSQHASRLRSSVKAAAALGSVVKPGSDDTAGVPGTSKDSPRTHKDPGESDHEVAIALQKKQAELGAATLPGWASGSYVLHLLDPQRGRVTELGKPPVTDLVSIVFVDVQSAAHLWETMPEVMPLQIGLYRDVLRSKRRLHEGYQFGNFGDRYGFAFSGPLSACRFAVDVQTALCAADWSAELCENPDTPTELVRGSNSIYLWRGLRVSIGIHHGAYARFDPSARITTFHGDAVECASLLQLTAVGGEILLSAEVAAAVSTSLPKTVAVVEEFGRMAQHRCRLAVQRMVHGQHAARLHYFKRELKVAEEAAVDLLKDVRSVIAHHYVHAAPTLFHGPPRGSIAMVNLAPAHLMELRSNSDIKPKVLETILGTYRRTVEALARSNRGHISRCFDSHYDIAFQQAYDAVNFAMKIQANLLEVAWPEELLAMPQGASVIVKSHQIFKGLRIRAGLHVFDGAFPELDPLFGSSVFENSKDGRTAAVVGALALPGETLLTSRAVDVVMRSIDRLRYPLCEPATASSLPFCDSVVTLYQLFSNPLAARATFLKREMALGSESADDRTEIALVARRNNADLLKKLEEKDHTIRNLERQTTEKTDVIAAMRRHLTHRDFRRVHVRDELMLLESLTYTEPTTVMALSFAHIEVLMEQWPDELPHALAVFDGFLSEMLGNFHGVEIRRAQSGAVRVMTFTDMPSAVDCWLSVVRNVQHLPWPERLLQSEHAGLVMASDITPGIHSSLDSVVWKGLRPIGGLLHGLPDSALNPCTRTMVCAGGIVNDCMMAMRRAQEGELLMPDDLGREAELFCEDRVTNASFEHLTHLRATRVFPAEMAQRYRVDITKQQGEAGMPERLFVRPEVRKANALVVHVSRQDVSLLQGSSIFEADVNVYGDVLRRCFTDFDATVINAAETEYLVGFSSIGKGADFCLKLHTALTNAPWSPSLLRLPECRPRWGSSKDRVMGGIHATVGCHLLDDVSMQVDLVEGTDVWVHRELTVPFLLARDADVGTTCASVAALPHLLKAKFGPAYHEACGSLVLPTDTVEVLMYSVLPVTLRERIVAIVDDTMQRSLAKDEEEYEKKQLRATRKSMKNAEEITRDRNAISGFTMIEPGIQESAHTINARAMKHALKGLMGAVEARVTAEDTMALLETTSMMAEDPFYWSEEQVAKAKEQPSSHPSHQELLFHHLEHAAVTQRVTFKRPLANDVILRATLGDSYDPDMNGDGDASGAFGFGGAEQSMSPGPASFRSMRRGKSGVASKGSFGPMVADGEDGAAVEGSSGHTVSVEDAIRLHVDVERFANLVLMFGVAASGGAGPNDQLLRSWIDPVYTTVVPDNMHPDENALEERLRDLSRQTRSLDVSEDTKHGVDGDELYHSIVANLSLALHRLCFEATLTSAKSQGSFL